MIQTDAFDDDMVTRFMYWMNERHVIFLRRIAGAKKPWTEDPILQEYKFTNVFRELDRVTVWIDNNIRVPYAKHPHLWFMMAIARQICHPETLQEMMTTGAWPTEDEWDWEYAASIMDDRKERGEQVYTGAYMIRAESDPRKEWYSWTKQKYMCGIVLNRVWEKREEFINLIDTADCSQEMVQDWFEQFHGWGGFMSYEVVTDLRHTRYLRNAPDIMTWANPGPGAYRGLNRIQNRPLKKMPGKAVAIAEMETLLRICNEEIESGSRLKHLRADNRVLEMRDIEHSLCEFDKYTRVRLGQGKPRSKYPGKA